MRCSIGTFSASSVFGADPAVRREAMALLEPAHRRLQLIVVELGRRRRRRGQARLLRIVGRAQARAQQRHARIACARIQGRALGHGAPAARRARARKSASAALRRRYSSCAGRKRPTKAAMSPASAAARMTSARSTSWGWTNSSGFDLARLEPAGGEIGGETDQAKAEPELQLGEIVGIGGIEQGRRSPRRRSPRGPGRPGRRPRGSPPACRARAVAACSVIQSGRICRSW